MNNQQLAIRNLVRNGRRSFTTIFTMVIGMLALLLFGGFISSIYFGLETGIVRSQGHLHIYPEGYLKFGSSRPTEFSINNYKQVIDLIKKDETLMKQIAVITPVVRLNGIAGNHAANTSKTFFASGILPSEYNKMKKWDSYNLSFPVKETPLVDGNIEQGVVGVGMAQMLNLCTQLDVPNCIDQPVKQNNSAVDDDILAFQDMAESELSQEEAAKNKYQGVQIDLLASTGSGAPNAVSVDVIKASLQGQKFLDDNYIRMHFKYAQKLIFSDDTKASAIVVQLKDTKKMQEVQTQITKLLSEADLQGQSFEVKNYTEFNEQFYKIINMFSMLFIFIVIVISLVVLFTTINTLTMSVMERITEIGSLRALGVRRSGIRRQFLMEGVMIGVIGATIGIIAAMIITHFFNGADLSWTPPSNASSTPLTILLYANPMLLIGSWILMVIVATVSSLIPARFAAKMNIVEAIRHS